MGPAWSPSRPFLMDRPSPTGYQIFFTLVTHGPFCFTGSTYPITTRALDYGFNAGGSSPLDSGIIAGGSGHMFQCSRKRALAPCELLCCIRALPSAGCTRTLGCSTLRRKHGITVIQQSNQLRFRRSRKPGVPNASHTGPDQRKSHTGTRSFIAAPQHGITVHSTIKSATTPQRQARRA